VSIARIERTGVFHRQFDFTPATPRGAQSAGMAQIAKLRHQSGVEKSQKK
jgi:hypothetical protein